jgi:hypothetical protein
LAISVVNRFDEKPAERLLNQVEEAQDVTTARRGSPSRAWFEHRRR